MMRIVPFKPRLDHALTFVLVVLVAVSLGLSAMIWTGTPVRLTIDRPGFFSSPSYGSTRSSSIVLQPQALFYWTQENQLYRVSNNTDTAHQLLRALSNTTILQGQSYGLAKSPYAFPPQGAYLKLDFGSSALSPSILAMLFMNIPPTLLTAVDGSLYITSRAHRTAYRLEYRTTKNRVFVAALRADKTLSEWMDKPSQAVPYAQFPLEKGLIYLPYSEINVPIEDWVIDRPVSSRIIDSFFTDPTVMQEIPVTSHHVLYTDGTRGVHMTKETYGDAIDYVQPGGLLSGVSQHGADAIATSVAFINEHGGFTGNVSMQIKPVPVQGVQGLAITFDQIVNGWPVYGQLGALHVQVAGNTVVQMSRPLAYLNELLDTTPARILSGSELLQKINPSAKKAILSISLGYGTHWLGTDIIELLPVYRITYSGQRVSYLDAETGLPFVGVGMD